MAKNKKIVEIVEGKTDILLIAPHGVNVSGVKKDDKRTAILTSEIAKELKLGCSALINDSIKRTELDYNIIAEATKDKEFIKNIRSVLDAEGPTLVVWIHGLADTSALNEAAESIKLKLFKGQPDELHALIGFGQGPDPRTGKGNNCM